MHFHFFMFTSFEITEKVKIKINSNIPIPPQPPPDASTSASLADPAPSAAHRSLVQYSKVLQHTVKELQEGQAALTHQLHEAQYLEMQVWGCGADLLDCICIRTFFLYVLACAYGYGCACAPFLFPRTLPFLPSPPPLLLLWSSIKKIHK